MLLLLAQQEHLAQWPSKKKWGETWFINECKSGETLILTREYFLTFIALRETAIKVSLTKRMSTKNLSTQIVSPKELIAASIAERALHK